MTGVGHNSGGSFAREALKSFIERIEHVNEEIEALTADRKEIFAEAKGVGFDTKIMREIIRLRKMDTATLQERDALLDLYRTALNMNSDLV